MLSAANGGHDETIRVLVKELGADIDQEYNGNTSMHYAAGKGHASTVETLLDLGADIHAQNDRGKKPYKYAKTKGIKRMLEHAMEKQAAAN